MSTQVTARDFQQVVRYEHDEQQNAKRVIIVGGGQISLNADFNPLLDEMKKVNESLNKSSGSEEVRIIEVTKEVVVPVKEIVIQEVEKPLVIREKEIELKEVLREVPVIVKEIVVKEVEKPIIVEKQVVAELPAVFRYALIAQAVISTLTLIALYFKK